LPDCLIAVPRRATPPKPVEAPPAQQDVPAVLARPKPVAAVPATAPRKKAPAKPKPLIVAPDVPAAVPASRQGPPRRTARIAPAGALPPAVIPREALVSPRHDRLLVTAIGLSVLLHLVVLTIHFSPIVLKQIKDKGPPIEVALVNAKTAAKPVKADVLAQHNLDGGGNTDADRRAKTPLPVLPRNAPDQQVAVATQKVEELEKQTRELMTQLRNAPVAQAMQAPTEARERTDLPTANELMQKTLEAMRLEAQIAKDMDAYQKRPKRRFIGARAEEYRFARYVEDWRLKIERIGNLNYPEAARKQKLYGSLLLTVSIRADGSVENVDINRGSGNRILDAAAVRIVNMSGPFAAFPPDIKKDTDILHITRTWTFAKGDLLESK
jgi:periplasmic protein TonB